MSEEPDRTTLERVSDMLADVADIIGLGSRVVNEISGLANGAAGKRLVRETGERAATIRAARKTKASPSE